MKIPDIIIQQCFDHGLECYPEEACGFISGPEGENPESFSVHPMENIINRLHQQDPENHPRQHLTASGAVYAPKTRTLRPV